MSTRLRSRRGRVRSRSACIASAVVLTCAAIGAAPSATADPSGDGSQPAVAAGIGPLLRILDFGTAIGFPLACNLATSVVTAGASQVHQSKAVSGVVTQIIDACTSLAKAGDGQLQAAIAKSQSMTLINPILNPVIEAMATGTRVVGSDHATVVAPFGPTIDGLGGTLAFFEGS